MKNYFKVSDKAYSLCLPLIIECSKNSLGIPELCKAISPQLSKLVGWNITTEIKPFVEQYFNFKYSVGRHQTMINASSFAPYWMYISDSPFCHHLHKTLDKLVYRYDDGFWNRYFVPNSWGCCCEVRNFTEKDLEGRDHRFRRAGEYIVQIQKPFDFNPAERDWLPVYRKLFIQHFAFYIYGEDNYEWNEDDQD